MTPEELLKPRYKVIADWPNCVYEVGKILTRDVEDLQGFYDKYPHLFKKLEWWEWREECDLPEYVKYRGCAYKVDSISERLSLRASNPIERIVVHLSYTIPATKEEYEAFKQSSNTLKS